MIDTWYERLAGCLLERSSADWLGLLQQIEIPCSPVNTIDDLLEDPHLKAIGFFRESEHPSEGALVGIRPPVRFSKTPCSADGLVPQMPGPAQPVQKI